MRNGILRMRYSMLLPNTSIAACRKPVIGVINGPAVGVGVTMTLPMDIRIAADTARFGFVFARRGLVPEAASTWFLPRVVGISQAMEWVATGRGVRCRGGTGQPPSLPGVPGRGPAAGGDRDRPGDLRQHRRGCGGGVPAAAAAEGTLRV